MKSFSTRLDYPGLLIQQTIIAVDYLIKLLSNSKEAVDFVPMKSIEMASLNVEFNQKWSIIIVIKRKR